MSRPREPIKAQKITGTDRYRVIFAEHPEWTFNTFYTNAAEAKRYALRNKIELFASRNTDCLFKNAAEGFFDEGGPWRTDQIESGRNRIAAMYQIYGSIITNHLIPILGEYNIATMLGKDIKAGLKSAMKVRGDGPLAKATKNRCLWVLNLMFDFWISQGLVTTNPIASITKYSDAPEKPRGALPRDKRAELFPQDYDKLLEIWGSPMWAAFFSYMNDTGTRNGEPRAMKWIDWEDDFTPINKAIEGFTTDKVKETKNGRERPGWPSPVTIEAFRKWKTVTKFAKDDDWIFTYRKGKSPITNNAVEKAFKAAMSRLGYEDMGWTPYWLRHTFVTYGTEFMPEDQLRLLAGDSDRINGYKHIDSEALRKKGFEAKQLLEKQRTGNSQNNKY
jgi:integrase